MQSLLPRSAPTHGVEILFCIQNVHVVHKIVQTKRARTVRLHEMAENLIVTLRVLLS